MIDFETASRVVDEHPDWEYKDNEPTRTGCGDRFHATFAGDMEIVFFMHRVGKINKEEA